MKTTILITGFGILTAALLSLSSLNLNEPTRSGDSGIQQTTDKESFAFGHNYQVSLVENKNISATENKVLQGVNSVKATPASPVFHSPSELEQIFLDAIVYVEEAEAVDLGFNPEAYLPAGFDPYAGMKVNPDDVLYLEIEEPIDLGFATEDYLPSGFDPYTMNVSGLDDINYMEEEETVELGFDVNEYLPAGFDPYARVTPDTDRLLLDNIQYIENEEPIEINTGLLQSMTIFFYPN